MKHRASWKLGLSLYSASPSSLLTSLWFILQASAPHPVPELWPTSPLACSAADSHFFHINVLLSLLNLYSVSTKPILDPTVSLVGNKCFLYQIPFSLGFRTHLTHWQRHLSYTQGCKPDWMLALWLLPRVTCEFLLTPLKLFMCAFAIKSPVLKSWCDTLHTCWKKNKKIQSDKDTETT